MKLSNRFDRFKAAADPTSDYLTNFCFEVEFFTHWPHQDHKTLNNLVGTHIKLVLLTHGMSEIITRQSHFDLSPGSVALIPPYSVYSAHTYEQVDSFEIFFNIKPITREQEFLEQFDFTQIQHFPGMLTSTDEAALDALYRDVLAKEPGSYAQLNALLTMLLVRLIRQRSAPAFTPIQSPKEQDVIRRLFICLEERLDESISVEELCTMLNVSQSYLYRCSRNVMKCSTQQIIIRHKLRHAQMLLKHPDMTIGEVAAAIGYDPFYFSSQFKKAFLLSPSQYRKNLCPRIEKT